MRVLHEALNAGGELHRDVVPPRCRIHGKETVEAVEKTWKTLGKTHGSYENHGGTHGFFDNGPMETWENSMKLMEKQSMETWGGYWGEYGKMMYCLQVKL